MSRLLYAFQTPVRVRSWCLLPGRYKGRNQAKTRSRTRVDGLTFRAGEPMDTQMADFTKEWIEHLKGQIAGRLNIVADKVDPQTYDELVTDLAWFTFRFARDPDTKMRKVFR